MASSSGDGTVQGGPQLRGAQEIIILNVKGAVNDIEVFSLVEAWPKKLQMMKDRELRTICDQWESTQTSREANGCMSQSLDAAYFKAIPKAPTPHRQPALRWERQHLRPRAELRWQRVWQRRRRSGSRTRSARRLASRLARATMLFVVLIAGHTWWQGGTGPIRGSSSVARVLEIVGVASHAHCKTASTPSTASWMDPSVSEAAGGTGSEDSGGGPRAVHPSPEDPSVHDKNSFAFASSSAARGTGRTSSASTRWSGREPGGLGGHSMRSLRAQRSLATGF